MNHAPPQAPSDRLSFFDALASRWDKLHPPGPQLPVIGQGLNLVEPLRDAVVVDIGCGTGIVTRSLLGRIGNGRVIAIDVSIEMIGRASLEAADARVEFRHGDALHSGIETASIDVALCYNAFPHFVDHAAAAREFCRWLRPGGRLLIWHDASRSAINAIHHEVGGAVEHDLLPPARDLAVMLERAGLQVALIEDLPDRYTVLARNAADAGHVSL